MYKYFCDIPAIYICTWYYVHTSSESLKILPTYFFLIPPPFRFSGASFVSSFIGSVVEVLKRVFFIIFALLYFALLYYIYVCVWRDATVLRTRVQHTCPSSKETAADYRYNVCIYFCPRQHRLVTASMIS